MSKRQRTVELNQIEVPSTYFVKGKLAFGRITSKIEGDELRKDIDRRTGKGLIPIETPYTTATVYSPIVIPVNANGYTPAEIYGHESFYAAQNSPTGLAFTANNKGNTVPWVCTTTNARPEQIKTTADIGQINQFVPTGELAQDLDVILVIRVFKGKRNNGQTLDGIIVLGEVKYYTTNANLSKYGINFNPVATPQAVETVEPAQQTPAQPVMPMPQVAPQVAPQPMQQPVMPMQQPPMRQVAPQPMPQVAPQTPVQQPYGSPFSTYAPYSDEDLPFN